MNKKDVLKYFGSAIAVADALDVPGHKCTRHTVAMFPDKLPPGRQYQIYYATGGKLKLDPDLKIKAASSRRTSGVRNDYQ